MASSRNSQETPPQDFYETAAYLQDKINRLRDTNAKEEALALERLKREIENMRLIMLEDRMEGRITKDDHDTIAKQYGLIAVGAVKSDVNQITSSYNTITGMCHNNIRLSKQHAVIGAVIGVMFVLLGMGISVLSHGAGLPLGVYIANIGVSLIAGAFAGALYPKARAEWQNGNIVNAACKAPTLKDRIYGLFCGSTQRAQAVQTSAQKHDHSVELPKTLARV